MTNIKSMAYFLKLFSTKFKKKKTKKQKTATTTTTTISHNKQNKRS